MCCFFAAWSRGNTIKIVLATIRINYSHHLFFSHSSMTFYTFGRIVYVLLLKNIHIELSWLWRLIKSNDCNEGHPKLDELNRSINACEMCETTLHLHTGHQSVWALRIKSCTFISVSQQISVKEMAREI